VHASLFSVPFPRFFARDILLLIQERFASFCLRHVELEHSCSRTTTHAQACYVLLQYVYRSSHWAGTQESVPIVGRVVLIRQ
jgi:hypothetical protein